MAVEPPEAAAAGEGIEAFEGLEESGAAQEEFGTLGQLQMEADTMSARVGVSLPEITAEDLADAKDLKSRLDNLKYLKEGNLKEELQNIENSPAMQKVNDIIESHAGPLKPVLNGIIAGEKPVMGSVLDNIDQVLRVAADNHIIPTESLDKISDAMDTLSTKVQENTISVKDVVKGAGHVLHSVTSFFKKL